MRKILTMLVLLATMSLTGCTFEGEEGFPPEAAPVISGEVGNEQTQNEEEEKNEATILQNDFALLEYMTDEENYMVSPFSLRMAMMMAANGAEGTTQEEILQALGVANVEEFNAQAKALIQQYNNNENVKLNVANSIWLNETIAGKDIRFAQAYQDLMKEYFDGEARVEDADHIVDRANQWVEDKTNGKIKNLLPKESNDLLAALINTIYFKGEWAEQFEESETYKDTFTDRKGKESSIDFMHMTKRLAYYEDENMKMVKLPYKGYETAMYVVLPTNEEKMDIANAIENMEQVKVKLSMPKFKTEYGLSMKELLMQLGVTEAFDANAAQFKNVMFQDVTLGQNVYIGDVLQKTFIDVDENGTEAAAATAVIMKLNAAMPIEEEIKVFQADRPFLYFILDEKTKQILFMGEYQY